jgi:hypothetical protein
MLDAFGEIGEQITTDLRERGMMSHRRFMTERLLSTRDRTF